MADAADLKSVEAKTPRAGSSPAPGIIIFIMNHQSLLRRRKSYLPHMISAAYFFKKTSKNGMGEFDEFDEIDGNDEFDVI